MTVTEQTPTRTRLPRAERERQMVDAALRLFAERGYSAVTMDDVATDVGVTKPLLYAYFGNKEQLYLAAVGKTGDGLVATVSDAFASAPDPGAALHDGMHAFLAFVAAEPEPWQVLYDETLPHGGQLAERVGAYRAGLTAATAHALLALDGRDTPRARVEADALAHALLAAAESTGRWWLRSGRDLTAAEAADLLIDTVTPGLAARAQEHR
jgi:AcrR family transcriptional regulator